LGAGRKSGNLAGRAGGKDDARPTTQKRTHAKEASMGSRGWVRYCMIRWRWKVGSGVGQA